MAICPVVTSQQIASLTLFARNDRFGRWLPGMMSFSPTLFLPMGAVNHFAVAVDGFHPKLGVGCFKQ
jgi:hypothetical protein